MRSEVTSYLSGGWFGAGPEPLDPGGETTTVRDSRTGTNIKDHSPIDVPFPASIGRPTL